MNVWGDIDAVSEASYLLFTQASLCYKSTAFVIRKGNLLKLLEYMDSSIFKPKSKTHQEMPVTPTKSPHYELGYLYQMISIYISAFLFIGVDSVAVTMIMFGCAQLDIIIDKLKKSENLREWLYQSPWYEQNMKFCRALWIAMERMKKPIVFKAGHYISLSRPTFVAILRCSYSYYTVLNRAKNE
ncbi:unnamed protein product [Arctia plantaginis]|uniref:Uncharacterized protein n=1 Tax=Arctia plantaginis TaxID=874455 RepID=A0A8S1ALY1_ARCPL|nr:unnamed protein product [Arctia plantaginis]